MIRASGARGPGVRFLLSVDEHMLFSALAFFGFFAASSLCSAL